MAEKIEWYGEIPIEDTWITFANQSDKGYIYDDPNNAHKITATTDANCASLYDVIKFVVNFNGNVYSRTCKVTFKQESGATDYCYISQNGTDFEQIWKHAPETNTSNTNPTDAVIAQSSNKTSNDFEVAVGNFNRTRPNLLFSVGNGKDENHRSNSFEVDDEKIKAKNANIEFLSADIISATTIVNENGEPIVNENGEPIVGGSKVSYEPTVTEDDDNSYEIGRLTIDNVENVIYGKSEDKKEENPTVTYIHIAYSNSSDDWAKESEINDPKSPKHDKKEWKYIGFNSSLVKSDSDLTYNDYTWSTYQGKLDISGVGYKLVPIQEEINAIPSENNGKVTKTINAFLTYRLVKTGENGFTEEEFDDTKVVKIYVGNNGNETTILASYFTGSRINDNKYWRITGSTPYYDNLQYYIVTCESNDGSQILDQRIVYVKMPTSTIFKVTEDAVRISQQASKDVRDLSDNVVTHTNFENDYNRCASSLTDSFVSIETFNDVEEQIQRTNDLIRTSSSNTFIVQELKEKLGSANLFGFSKGIIFWSDTLPDIQKYGFVANSKLGRIKNLGLNGENGDYTIAFNAYTNYGGELKVNFNLCDVDAKEGIQTLTTTIQHYELHYTLEDNEYIYSDKNYGYNGFFDCERVDENANGIIYVSNLKIEKGVLSTNFSIAPEDVENFNNGNLVSPTEWTFNSLAKTDEKIKGYDVYVNTENPTVSSPTIDYIYLNGVDIEDETPYTLSFWAKSNMEGAVITSHFYWNGGIINGVWGSVAGDGKTNTILQTTWKKYYIHWYTCLTSINSTSNTKSVLPLRISYGENNSVNGSAKIYIAGVKFEKGFVNDNSKLPNSIKSQIQQTASSIKLSVQKNVENKLVKTGIDIENGKITLNADNTTVKGDFKVSAVNKADGITLINEKGEPAIMLKNQPIDKTITDVQNGKFGGTTNIQLVWGTEVYTPYYNETIGTQVCYIQAGKQYTIANMNMSIDLDNAGSLSPIKIQLSEGGTVLKTISNAQSSGLSSLNGTYTATHTGSVDLSMTITTNFTTNGRHPFINITGTITRDSSSIIVLGEGGFAMGLDTNKYISFDKINGLTVVNNKDGMRLNEYGLTRFRQSDKGYITYVGEAHNIYHLEGNGGWKNFWESVKGRAYDTILCTGSKDCNISLGYSDTYPLVDGMTINIIDKCKANCNIDFAGKPLYKANDTNPTTFGANNYYKLDGNRIWKFIYSAAVDAWIEIATNK